MDIVGAAGAFAYGGEHLQGQIRVGFGGERLRPHPPGVESETILVRVEAKDKCRVLVVKFLHRAI